MALKDTVNVLKKLIEEISRDLDKAIAGNKAASQRVRTGSIKFEKTAKNYRKESVTSERKMLGKRSVGRAKKNKGSLSSGKNLSSKHSSRKR